MPRRWTKNELLSQKQGGGKGRRHLTWKLLAVIAGAVVLGAISFSARMKTVEEAEAEAAAEEAKVGVVVEAQGQVEAAAAMALEFIASGEAEAELEARREELAKSAAWSEGEATLVAGELRPNESLYVALQGRNIPTAAVHFSVTAMGEEFNFRRSRPGDQWRAELDEKGRIIDLRYQTSPEDIWRTIRVDEGVYETEKLDVDVEVRQKTLAGTIESSFWLALEATGESGALAYRFMEVFQYTIDFNTETRQGDYFAMVYEKIYLDGEFLRYGRVLAAQYLGENARQEAYFHQSDDESGYYDSEGESMQRQFLRSPLEVTRVTSRYGRRVHPITGSSRMHRGVDYGAPTGTRVRAVANGRVHFAGRRGGYGNLLIIRHSGGYETRFAHLSRFEAGIRSGVSVSQGQIVARVGSTGMSTGPHLHYEMLRNGQHIDPFSIRATSGDPLRGGALAAFKEGIVDVFRQEMVRALTERVPEAVALLTPPDDGENSVDGE